MLRAGRWLLAASIFGSAMALGALHTTVLIVVALALGAAAFVAWWGAEPMRARPAATVVFWVAVGLTALTLVQSIPLPARLLALLAPASADVWARCLSPLRQAGPSWATISVDPTATRIQVLRGAAYLAAFIAAVRIARRREGIVFLEGAIVVTGLALAIAAWVHPVVGAERVFGLYKPTGPVGERHIAPLLNANMLAAYLNVAFCIALADVLAPLPSVPRVITGTIVAMLFGTQLWVASRGGVATMIMGAALVVWMRRLATREAAQQKIALFAPLALVVTGVVMGVLSASEEAWQELASADMTKLELSIRGMRVAWAFPMLGAGRGAFEAVFPAFREGTGYTVYTHPENFVVQWLSEWGLPLGLTAIVTLGFALRPGSALARSSPAAGAWAAISTVAVHNLADFSSELPALVVALSVCAAIVLGGTAGTRSRTWLEKWALWPAGVAVGGALACAIAVVWAVPAMGHELTSDRTLLREAAIDGSIGPDAFRALAHDALLRHPAEPYLPYAGALWATRSHAESVIPWVERTLERAPVYGPAHYLLARELSRRSPAQARLEYRLAMTQDDRLVGQEITEGAQLVGGYYDALELVPDGPAGLGVLESLAEILDVRLPATRVRLDAELLRRSSTAEGALTRALADARSDLIDGEGAPWCAVDRAACIRQGLALSDRLERAAPNKCAAYAMRVPFLVEQRSAARALDALQTAADKVEDRTACLRQLIVLSINLGDQARATAAIDQLARMGCAAEAECVDNLIFVGQVEEGRHNPRRALAFYKKAHDAAPQRPEVLERIASLSSASGLHAEALEAYRALAQLQPETPVWKDAVAREEKLLVTEVLPH